MEYIALNGPPYSGKTTLAKELQKEGYLLISFTDTLKFEALIALRSVGLNIDMDMILMDKKRYRGFLQELGVLLDFDHNPEWVIKSLKDWFDLGRPKAVFDNVRTLDQFMALKPYGFELVELCITPNDLVRRANSLGVSTTALNKVLAHPIEAGIHHHGPDLHPLRLDATIDPQTNMQYLIGNPSNQFTSGLIGRETALPQNETAVSQLPDLPTLRGIPIVDKHFA